MTTILTWGVPSGNSKYYRRTDSVIPSHQRWIVDLAWSLEYLVVLWSIDSKDWSGLKPSSIAVKILKTVKPGSIILFHDLGGYRDTTVKTLEILLPELTRKGYRCLTVSQLLERAGHASFTSKRD
ncbi:MAG: hypothetical protein GXY86_08290 [Firmicutes bacterium]|nr:hypothetical protein [Bacillota bacterium]